MASSNNETVIGADAQIKGEVTFASSAKILGTIEGSVVAKGDLHVAAGANCRASIDATKVTVDGLVQGNVKASERLELSANARLEGDLEAAKLIVAEGASFTGHCKIGGGSKASSNGSAASVAETKPDAGRTESKDDDDAGRKAAGRATASAKK